jgi:hypothetical protein
MLKLEDCLTPLELAKIAAGSVWLDRDTRAAFEQLHIFQLLRHAQPATYLRQDIATGITFYNDPNFNPENKALIIAFGGAGTRLSMSMAVFLQLVPSAKFDIAVLRDPSRNHYLTGLGDYADDFPRLVFRLSDDLGPERYRNVFCYGASMGGFPALRCGLLLGGVRAISVSGRFPWFVGRLVDRSEKLIPAFDMLCACRNSQRTDFVCVYGEHSKLDSESVDRLENMFPVRRFPVAGVAEHNVIYEIWKRGMLEEFYAKLFSIDREYSRPPASSSGQGPSRAQSA